MIPIPPKIMTLAGKLLLITLLMASSWYAGGRVKEAEVVADYNAEAAKLAQAAIDIDMANRVELASQAREFNKAITQEKVKYERSVNEILGQPVLGPVSAGDPGACPTGFSADVVRVLEQARNNPALGEADP